MDPILTTWEVQFQWAQVALDKLPTSEDKIDQCMAMKEAEEIIRDKMYQVPKERSNGAMKEINKAINPQAADIQSNTEKNTNQVITITIEWMDWWERANLFSLIRITLNYFENMITYFKLYHLHLNELLIYYILLFHSFDIIHQLQYSICLLQGCKFLNSSSFLWIRK